MKKILLSVFALSLTTAWGQSTAHISNLSLAPGATPALTFNVSWTAPPSATPSHRDTIWLFADYRTVNTDGSTGAWTPAGITSATLISGAGTLITSTLPGRGFFLDGHGLTTLNATIRVTLDAPVSERFNACVYASDWPPNAILNPGGGYTLNGSPPFIINGTITENTRTFGAGTCVTAITDATGCPGFVVNTAFAAGAIASTGETICEGGTPVAIGSTTDATGGDGNYVYEWRLNNAAIASSNSAAWTPAAQSATIGSHTYTRWVKDGTCNTSFTQSAGSWILTVIADPTVTVSAAEMFCSGTAPAAMTATPSGGTGTISYQWYSGASADAVTNLIGGATASTYAPGALTETTYYTVVVSFTVSGCAATATAIAKTIQALSPGSMTSTTTTICVGGAVEAITASAPSGGNGTYAYKWKQGGSDATGTGHLETFTPAGSYLTTAGTYHFTRNVSSCSGEPIVTTTGTYTLIVVPDPSVTVSSAQSVCSGATPAAMTATTSNGTGDVSYQWYSGASAAACTTLINGATASTYAPDAITATTFYTASASFTGSGCNAATATAIAKSIYPALNPGTMPSATTTICEAGSVSALTATNPTGGNGTYTYQWKQGANNASGAANSPSFLPSGTYLTTPGTYYFTRVVTSCTSGTTSGTHTLIVATTPTVTTPGFSVCALGAQPLLSATGSGTTSPATYSWIVDGAAAVTTSYDHYYQHPILWGGTYTYSVTVINSTGCSSTAAPGTITFSHPPTVTLAASSTLVCAGMQVTLTATGSDDAIEYSFTNGSWTSPWQTDSTITVTVTSNRTLTVKARSAETCESLSAASVAVYTTSDPIPTVTLTTSSSTACASVCTPVKLTATSSISPASYSFDNGISWQTSSTLNVSITGNTTCTVIARSAASCISEPDSVTIEAVFPGTEGEAPHAICGCTPELQICGDGLCQTSANCNVTWTACSAVASAVDAHTGLSHSGFTVISNTAYELKDCNRNHKWLVAHALCAAKGMRLPTRYEMECICQHRADPDFPGGLYDNDYYGTSTWNSTQSYYLYVVTNTSCYVTYSGGANDVYVKCVKD
ncbi:MAG: hypothetical protein LBS12_07860 [Prevotellaceae bacterium]|jgi:hypothetical protein|nr:hypothetical protein [Prevotellaceae bacterium]